MTTPQNQGVRVNRAEWGVIVALAVNLLTLAFMFGGVWTTLNQNTKDIVALQVKTNDQAEKLTRIDANVTFLAERAREDRENQQRGRL